MKSALNKERLYENLLASIEEGVIVLDKDERIIVFNVGAEEIIGVSSGQAIGSAFSDIIKNNEILDLPQKVCETGKTYSGPGLEILRRDLSVLPVSCTVSPLMDEEGSFLGSVIVLRDMSRIKNLEEDLRRSDRLGTMGALAAGLAHEIKNPLGGIKGSAQLLDEELAGNDRLREFTGIIVREADRVNRLIGELLDFAKPRKLSIKPFNIHKTIDDTFVLMSETIRVKGIAVYKEFDPSIPLIKGDRERIAQVVLNMVKNSLEALDKGGWIMVSSRISTDFQLVERDERKGVVILEVSDNGKGMDKENLDRLFTPFYSTKEKGMGLGLAISHRIIKEHKGTIKVRSRVGEGTTFSITLPVN